MHRSRLAFSLILAFALALTLARAGHCQVEILLDVDADSATGCTVTTVDGLVDGVDEIVEASLAQQGIAPGGFAISDLSRRECVSPATNSFGPPVRFDLGGWLALSATGVDFTRAIELYWPIPSHGNRSASVLAAVEIADQDALLNLPVTLSAVSTAIPTLSEWGALLLALLLAGLASRRLRRGPRVAWLALVLALGLATTAWAVCVLDGEVNDWAGIDPLGLDPFGDSTGGADLRAVLVQECPGRLCIRIDAALPIAPIP
jgi:hypothetical protein